MAKKITVAMLKSGRMPSDEDVKEIIEQMEKAVKSIKGKNPNEITWNALAPITEDNYDELAGIGAAVMYLMKLCMTPAAWKYYANDFIKTMTSEEVEEY